MSMSNHPGRPVRTQVTDSATEDLLVQPSMFYFFSKHSYMFIVKQGYADARSYEKPYMAVTMVVP